MTIVLCDRSRIPSQASGRLSDSCDALVFGGSLAAFSVLLGIEMLCCEVAYDAASQAWRMEE